VRILEPSILRESRVIPPRKISSQSFLEILSFDSAKSHKISFLICEFSLYDAARWGPVSKRREVNRCYRMDPAALVVVALPDPFRVMGARRNSTETQQSDLALRPGPEVKIEVVPKKARRRGSDADNPEGGEPDPTDNVYRSCRKDSPFPSTYTDKRTKEGCDHGSEVRTAHSRRKGPGLLKKSKESGRRENCEKDFASRQLKGQGV